MFALHATVDLPEFVADGGASLRFHNATTKGAIRSELEDHRRNTIPEHFKHSARQRYGYHPRTAKYFSWKLRNRGKTKRMTDENGNYVLQTVASNANLDLIRTGNTQRKIQQSYKITTGGSGNTIRGLLTLKVPIPGGSGRGMDLAAQLRLLKAGKIRQLSDRVSASSRMETVRRTISEIERFSDDEISTIGVSIAKYYANAMNENRNTVRRVIRA